MTDNSTLDNPEQKVDDPLRVTKAVPIITEMMDVLSSEDAYFILKSNDDLFTEGEKTLPGKIVEVFQLISCNKNLNNSKNSSSQSRRGIRF